MEERTLLLLRTLQTAERTEAGLAGVRAMLTQERPGLRAFDDRATLADASELLEVWSEAAPPNVAAGALVMAGEIAEQDLQQLERAVQLYQRSLELAPTQLTALDALQRGLTGAGRGVEFEPMLAAHIERLAASEGLDPELLAQQLQRLGTLRNAGSDLAGAIAAYERAVEHSADPDLVRDLAEAYARRSAPGDGTQAAELFTMLAEVLGPPESTALIERALDLAPGNLPALSALEAVTPEAERATKLLTRWERFVDSADDEEAIDARRPLLARAYLAVGREKAALTCIGPLVDRGDAAAAELQAECLAALRVHEATPTAAGGTSSAKNEVPREATLVGFRLPRSSAPPEAGPDSEPVAGAPVRKPDSGVHKRPAPRSGGTLVGFRLSEETLAALKAQEAAEASMKARAKAEAAHEPSDEAEARSDEPSTADAEASTSTDAAAEASASAGVDAGADPLRSPDAASPAAAPSATPALSPAEHAARLRRSSAPPPAMASEASPEREQPAASKSAARPSPKPAAAATPAAAPRGSSARASSARASSARASSAQSSSASSSAAVASAARPRPSSGPVARPSAAPALSPAQLAQNLRSSASTPPPARSASPELPSASAAAAHAANLRRSSSGSIPAPAPRASAAPSAGHAHASSAAAAASAHAAMLRRSSSGSSGTFAGATAMSLPAENVVAAAPPVLSAVASPAELPAEMPAALPAELEAPSAQPELAAEAQYTQAQHSDGGADAAADAGADAGANAEAGEYADASGYTEDAPHDAAATAVDAGHYDQALAAAPSASVPPPGFGVGPSTMPDLAGGLGEQPSGGGSRKLLVIGALAAVGIGAAVMLFGSDKKEAPASPVAEAPPPSAATAPTAALPTAAAPATTAVAPTAAAPTAAAAPGAGAAGAPSGLPGDLAGAVAAPATDTATATGTAAAAPTQDEKVLGRVELAGAAKIRGGKLRPKDVAEAVREQLPALERCYTETLEDKPKAAGELTFSFTVARTGKPTGVKKLSGTLKDPGLVRCATEALGDARFDKPKRPAKVTLPLRFAKL